MKQKTNNKKLSLSIVIPVYNEKENIIKTLDEIKKNIKTSHEIIIVYDFDKDTTLPILNKVKGKYKEIHIVKNNIKRGPSGAIRTGIKYSTAPMVLVTMADLCDDLSQVEKMLRITKEKADIVCPSRYMKGGEQQLNSPLKVWAPRVAGALLKFLAGIPTFDPTNSYKLYSRKVFDKIELESTISFSVTLEIVVKAYVKGFRIVEIPTVWRDRQNGKTNFKLTQSLVAYLPWFFYAVFNRFSIR